MALGSEDLIPEVVINRQLPKRQVNLALLRPLSVRGRKAGSRGRETYLYKKV